MRNFLLWFLVIGLVISNPTSGSATTERLKPDYGRWLDFENMPQNTPGLQLITGEIIRINEAEIRIKPFNANEGIYRLKLVPDTKIYCNGSSSQWEALKPVASGAYFEAQVLVDGKMEAISVNAFYYGEECVVKKCYQKQGKLIVELISVLSEENFTYPVKQEARLPRGDNWKQEGQLVYILYHGRDEIRAVFLPN